MRLPNGGAGVDAKSKGGGGCSAPDTEVDPEGTIEPMVKALGSSSGGGGGPNGPKVPPKIDRQKKPSRRSASERLFGNGEVSGNYINSENSSTATPPSSGKSSQQHHTPRTHSSSLDRHTHIRDMKLVRVLHSIWLPTNICELHPNTYHFSLCMTASTLTTRMISSPHR